MYLIGNHCSTQVFNLQYLFSATKTINKIIFSHVHHLIQYNYVYILYSTSNSCTTRNKTIQCVILIIQGYVCINYYLLFLIYFCFAFSSQIQSVSVFYLTRTLSFETLLMICWVMNISIKFDVSAVIFSVIL